jgi:hypothetical protein
MVTCTVCERRFEPPPSAKRVIAARLKAGIDDLLAVDCPFCKRMELVEIGPREEEPLRCPVPSCAGFVSRVTEGRGAKKASFWGCGECGSIWREVSKLHREIESITKRFPYRKQCYKKVGKEWHPGRTPSGYSAKVAKEPREKDREYERG